MKHSFVNSKDFNEVKQNVNMLYEIERRTGFKFKKVGKSHDLSECPFCHGHDCFRASDDKGIWLFKCHQCDTQGSIIDFVMKSDGLSELEALEQLADQHGISIQKGSKPGPFSQYADIFEVAANYYHNALMSNKHALEYQTKQRGHSIDTLKAFKIGFSDGRIISFLLNKGFTNEQILKSGLGKKDEKTGRLKDLFFKGLFVYPHVSISGRVGHFSVKGNINGKKMAFQLKRLGQSEAELFFNAKAFRFNKLILVEGQNDAMTVWDKGKQPHIAAIIGNLSGEQIEYIRKWASTGKAKSLYMCFDNDKKGKEYTKALYEALKGFCITDRLLFENFKLRKKQITAMQLNADNHENDDDIQSKLIEEARQIRLYRVNFNNRCKDIDEYLNNESRPDEIMASLMEGASSFLMPLRNELQKYREWASMAGLKPFGDDIGELMFAHFHQTGKFFVDNGQGVCKLFFKNKMYDVNSAETNLDFMSLLYDEAGMNISRKGIKEILTAMKAKAVGNSEHISSLSWIYTDIQKTTIYFNLCNDRNEIIKLSPGMIELIPNGTNPERILLNNSPYMEGNGITYIQDVDVQEAMNKLKETIMDNFTCSLNDRYYLLCIMINSLFINFVSAVGLNKFSGAQGTAKTAATEFITTFFYNKKEVTTGSVASYSSESAQSPIITIDNLENENINKTILRFLLILATGGTNQKRAQGTNSKNVYERFCSQALITAIEPFIKSELISRTNDIIFDKKYKNPDFQGATAIMAKIQAHRDMMWSGIFKMVAYDILPGLAKKQKTIFRKLMKEYSGHAKERLNELYAMLNIICEALVKYIPHPEFSLQGLTPEKVADEILMEWLANQTTLAESAARGSNDVLYRLELLVKEFLKDPVEFEEVYGLEVEHDGYLRENNRIWNEKPLEISFTCPTRDLFSAFQILSKTRNCPMPFQSVNILVARVKNSLSVLKSSGWDVEFRVKAIRGTWHNFFTKKLS